MTREVYITDLASFLPNAPVGNDEMEGILGMVGGRPSRSRKLVLKNNGIKIRHYAIDPATGKYTHTNAQLAAEAVRALAEKSDFKLDEMDCLCCGTSSADVLLPAHAHMVHGELSSPPCEVVSTAGVCSSAMTAMKYAYMGVALGLFSKAVSTGSELASSFMRASNFESEMAARVAKLEKNPSLAFEKDFLRWMLSDGAGAALLSPKPNRGRISLRIDWIEYISYAGDMPVCMYNGAVKRKDGSLKGWREADELSEALKESYFSVKQDARVLDEHIIHVSVNRALAATAAKRGLKAGDVAWFLPHYSSEYFRPKLAEAMKKAGFDIPGEKWFTNLTSKGNIGSAAIYLILEEMLYSGRIKKGEKLLCYIPESARFSICYMLLTAV